MKKIIWIDTETTGLDATKGALTEVACIVEIDGVEVDKLALQINPLSYNKDVEVTQEALDITGKTMEDIASYGDSKAQFNKFIVFLSKYVDHYDKKDKLKVNGYNTKFDVAFIKEWFLDNGNKYYGSYFDYKELDVFALVGYIKHLGFIDTENDKLKTICDHFGIDLDAHKAFDDIVATKKLGELLSERFIGDNSKDRLAELEAKIREWFIANDMTTDSSDWFELKIGSLYKNKYIEVNDQRGWAQHDHIVTITGETTKEMFDKAFEYFRVENATA